MTHGWYKQAMMLGFDFKSKYFRVALELFKCTEVTEAIYEGDREPYKINRPGKISINTVYRKNRGEILPLLQDL